MWGFTRIQQRAILFLLAAFGLGCGILWYRRQQMPPPVSPAFAAQLQSLARDLEQDSVSTDTISLVPARGAAFHQQSAAALRVNINLAGPAELMSLPGIGAAMAQRIVDYRVQNGKFRRLEELTRVKGIGKRKLEALRGHVVVE